MQTQDKKLYRDFTSQEEIDLEYNMAITVSDAKRWMSIFINLKLLIIPIIDMNKTDQT